MTGVKFNGRMGNQIFQFVFLQYLRTNNKKSIFFFANPQDAYLNKYFKLGFPHDLGLLSRIYTLFSRSIYKITGFKEIYLDTIHIPKLISPESGVVYKGYFQTDLYVKNIIGDFSLEIKEKFKVLFDQQFGELFNKNKVIAVHIRRTDYLKYGKRDISLPIEYFKGILDSLGNIDDCKIIFVSDDIEYVKAFFKEKPNYLFSVNDEITDFQIIQNADIAIISNSSFAWWAAYLSKKQNLVYAPKNWLGFRLGKSHPKSIMTDRFTWCDVFEKDGLN